MYPDSFLVYSKEKLIAYRVVVVVKAGVSLHHFSSFNFMRFIIPYDKYLSRNAKRTWLHMACASLPSLPVRRRERVRRINGIMNL